MTRKELARSIVSHLRLLARSDIRDATHRYKDCFVSFDVDAALSNQAWISTYIHSTKVFESWPKTKLEQVLFDLLRDELNQVRMSSYATERANRAREERSTLSTTAKMKLLDIWDPRNTQLVTEVLDGMQIKETTIRCHACMWTNSSEQSGCRNPACRCHDGW